MFLSACDPAEESMSSNMPDEPECVEMSPSPSEICQRDGLTLATEADCTEAECQTITYETTCSGSREALCLVQEDLCFEFPPDPNEICEAEGQVLATQEECAEIECQQVTYPSECGQMGQTLCRAPDITEPLSEICAERDEAQCGGDDACRWLIPEPWACAEPEELLPNAGCFSVMWCSGDADCGEGEQCSSVAFGECDQPGDACEACATYENICLPSGEQE